MNNKPNNIIPEKLGKGIYRGIYVEIAKEKNCTPENVRAAIWKYHNHNMIQLALQKMAERKNTANKFNEMLTQIN